MEGVPIQQQRANIYQDQLLNQLEDVCSSYFSADLPFRTPDVLGELCVLILVQKSKDMKVRDNPSKRVSVTLSVLSCLLHQVFHLSIEICSL
ncbi:unnamed protein product [Oncorhynchus mykiss]|uniref:Uncharacterized protein n=1 Tax=Oncorhynchus mykiss TaxID=8022 RepID=A0A060XHZ1_ONCMY|nr:unnamed protein product [Oncorhynchus mykiss]